MNKIDKKLTTFFGIEHWKVISYLLMLYDAVCVSLAYFIALWLRFDCRYSMIPDNYYHNWLFFTPVYILFCILLFSMLKLYRSIWRFASFSELMRICDERMYKAKEAYYQVRGIPRRT